MDVKNWSMEWGGKTLSVEVGKLALQAHASCTVRFGDTVILATATMSRKTRDGIDFFPLMVNFEEKLYAGGRIKGSRFIKREGRPSEDAVLSGRLIDRAIRPLFDESMRNDVQVILTTLSYDGETDPQIPAMFAASLALSISPIPWDGPIAGARVGRKDGQWVLNPTHEVRDQSDTDIVVAGTPEKVIMVEAGCREVPDDDVVTAIQFGAQELKPVVEFIEKIIKEVGKEKFSLSDNPSDTDKELAQVEKEAKDFVAKNSADWIFGSVKKSRAERVALIDKFSDAIKEMLDARADEVSDTVKNIILGRVKLYVEEHITEAILKDNKRLDGRALDEVRELNTEVSLLPRTHGSAMFMRGDTQVLSTVTLGAPGDVQTLDSLEEEGTKRYMHHYNDTPATYGEAGPLRGPGNRAIGHGALAERALLPVLPDQKDFPYAIRVVSEVLGSNGSSSMASTCGSTLALMDAGVKIKKPVAGIAIGLASNKHGDWKVLTDLQDVEDGPGGMDFKITGTRDGITAMQMDTKTDGLNWEIIKETFSRAKTAREQILDKIEDTLAAPREEMSPYAPRIVTVMINPDKIRDVVGPGGKMINQIIDETGVAIDIEQDGTVNITSDNAEGLEKAQKWINDLTHEVTAGEIYEGEVVRLEDFGAFINLLPGQDGLVHVSDIAWTRTEKPGDALNLGDKVKVKVKEIDNLGRINLTMKELKEKPEGYVEPPRFDRRSSHNRNDRHGGRPGGRGGRDRRPRR